MLQYIGYMGMYRWKGYGFQAIYSGIGLVIIENWSRIGCCLTGSLSG